MESLGDVNGNGTNDLLVLFRGDVLIMEGATREVLYRLPRSYPWGRSGHDWNDDGFPDFFIDQLESSLVVLPTLQYSSAPFGVRVAGATCHPATTQEPRIGASDRAIPGERFRAHVSRVAPDTLATLLIGDEGELSSHSLLGTPPCISRWKGTRVARGVVEEIRPGEGAMTVSIDIPEDAALIGTTFELQWGLISRDAATGGLATSTTRVLQVTVQRPDALRERLAPVGGPAEPR